MCGRGRKKFKDKNGKDLDDGFDSWVKLAYFHSNEKANTVLTPGWVHGS